MAHDDLQLSPNFWLSEFTQSQTAVRLGLRNEPLGSHIDSLRRLAVVLEGVRSLLSERAGRDAPIIISSGYRSSVVNARVGGSKASAHTEGRAADFVAPSFGSPRQICLTLVDAGFVFDQLIHEGRWVHLAIPKLGAAPRRSVLTAIFARDERTRYVEGIL